MLKTFMHERAGGDRSFASQKKDANVPKKQTGHMAMMKMKMGIVIVTCYEKIDGLMNIPVANTQRPMFCAKCSGARVMDSIKSLKAALSYRL